MHQTGKDRTRKILLKVIIIGSDYTLQAGFLNMVAGANISYQLYNTLNICIGVMKVKREDTNITLQMWSLPLVERFKGLTSSFMKGHHAAIIVLREDELYTLDSIISALPRSSLSKTMLVVVGDDVDISGVFYKVQQNLERLEEMGPRPSVVDTIMALINHLAPENKVEEAGPILTVVPTASCPPLEYPILPSTAQRNSEEEVKEIMSVATEFECEVDRERNVVLFDHQYGSIELSVKTGIVTFFPHVCKLCKNPCRRRVRLCIVTSGTGWTNTSLSNGALFTMAKLYAFARHQIPVEVEAQMYRAAICSKYDQADGVDEELVKMVVPTQRRPERVSLLDAALQRVRSGRLSPDALKLLKKKLRIAQQQ